jgi:hypothetical protein
MKVGDDSFEIKELNYTLPPMRDGAANVHVRNVRNVRIEVTGISALPEALQRLSEMGYDLSDALATLQQIQQSTETSHE